MTDYRIEYIVKPNPYGRIQAVGGNSPRVWRDTEDNVITAISNGDTFHVSTPGFRVAVMVERNHNPPFLKTMPDGTKLDNLLSLPKVA
jgi:hypothetical protein